MAWIAGLIIVLSGGFSLILGPMAMMVISTIGLSALGITGVIGGLNLPDAYRVDERTLAKEQAPKAPKVPKPKEQADANDPEIPGGEPRLPSAAGDTGSEGQDKSTDGAELPEAVQL